MFADARLRTPFVPRTAHHASSSPAAPRVDAEAPSGRRWWRIGEHRRREAFDTGRDGQTLGPAWQVSALRTLYGA